MTFTQKKQESHLFGNLSILHRFGKVFVKNWLLDREISCPPPHLMTIWKHEGLSQDELSNFLRLDKGAIAKTTKRMEKNGYIKRVPCQEDKRKYNLFLTEKGEKTIPEMQKIEITFREILTQDMSDDEIKELLRLLAKAANNILIETKKGGYCNEQNA